MPKDLHEKLRQLAFAKNVSRNTYILEALERAIAKDEKEQLKAQQPSYKERSEQWNPTTLWNALLRNTDTAHD